MRKKKTGKIISVKEIPQKIKEIEKPAKAESSLESEVEQAEREFSMNQEGFVDLAAPILKPSQREAAEILPATNSGNNEQKNFSQSISYTARPQETKSTYANSPRPESRFVTSVLPENPVVREGSSGFRDKELAQLRGQDLEKKYNSPLDAPKEKPKRRYPWEA